MRAEYLPAIAEAMEADVNALDEAERKKTICKAKKKWKQRGSNPWPPASQASAHPS